MKIHARHFFGIIKTLQNIDCKQISLNPRWLYNDEDADDNSRIQYNYQETDIKNDDNQDKDNTLKLNNPKPTISRGRPPGRYKSFLEKVSFQK